MKPPGNRAPDKEALLSAIESILLVAGEPVSAGEIGSALDISRSAVRGLLGELQERLNSGIRLQIHGDSVQLVTAPENTAAVQRFLGAAKPPALSRPALEVLTIIAYYQPLTRAEIEERRGVNSDRIVQSLVARGLIEERGRRETLGRPMEYGTGFGFLQYFGLQSLDELPPLPTKEREEPVDLGMRQK